VRADSADTRFAVAPDGAHVAYQAVGEGRTDVVLSTDWASSIDLMWEEPRIERFLRRLMAVGRLILFDKRGNGASDAAPPQQGRFGSTLEQAAEDLLVVIDAVGSERPAVVASTYGGWPALLFAATHPDRCGRLVLQDCCARLIQAEDYAPGIDAATLDWAIEGVGQNWGRGITLATEPDLWTDHDLRRWYGRYERLSVERTYMLQGWRQLGDADVRAVLPMIQAPTLVIAHDENRLIGSGSGAYLAQHIPGAELVQFDGVSTLFWGDERNVEHIARFLGAAKDDKEIDDRVLAAVLFTDLVSSTPAIAKLGDRRWRELLDSHDARTAEIIARFRGRLITRTGDGLLAIFDGPARAVRCAEIICDEIGRLGMDVRAGVHAGEVELRGENISGIAVHLAARIMSIANGGQVIVSRTIKDLTAGSGLGFIDLGAQHLKGFADPWQVFELSSTG
jgi:class 3 adenylate cyclase/pimeloyl-ACP methyl ester carboxylesterase